MALIYVSVSRAGGGVDSSYYIQSNVVVKRGIFGGISIYSIYKWGYYFSLVYTFEKAIKCLK
jgi:hypothetical protein